MENDDELFRQQMQDVSPLTTERAALKSTPEKPAKPDLAQQAARAAATEDIGVDPNHLVDSFIPDVSPDAILEFARPGVQHGVLKKMRLGKYTVDARLDLHKHTVEQARQAVFQFSGDCLRYDVRTALIVHGKGKEAIIKSCVNHWLRNLPDVLAFHTAQKHHGGSGAVYVLFRKSDTQKQKNKERHTRR